MVSVSKGFELENEIPDNWNEKKDILSEWSKEIYTSLESLRDERTKIIRHINHLASRIKFLEKSCKNSESKEDCLEKLKNLQSEISSLDKEILSKEELLRQINT